MQTSHATPREVPSQQPQPEARRRRASKDAVMESMNSYLVLVVVGCLVVLSVSATYGIARFTLGVV